MSGRLYFDVVSPFAYLMLEQLHRLPPSLTLEFKPVLLAGLLDYWGHKGPAEIPSKRRFTYRWVQWQADRLGVPLRFPDAHPFNPLPLLRLAVLVADNPDAIRTLFRTVWREGTLPGSAAALDELGRRVGIDDAGRALAQTEVKDRLRRNFQEAVNDEVFGVPSIVLDDQLFWGVDSLDILLDYLSDPGLFRRGELARVSNLPIGVMRKIN